MIRISLLVSVKNPGSGVWGAMEQPSHLRNGASDGKICMDDNELSTGDGTIDLIGISRFPRDDGPGFRCEEILGYGVKLIAKKGSFQGEKGVTMRESRRIFVTAIDK